MTLPPGIGDVLARHFSPRGAPAAGPPAADHEEELLLKAVGLDPRDPGLPERVLMRATEGAEAAGLEREAVLAIAHAYGRGLGRVAAAQAEMVRRAVRPDSPSERPRALDALLSATLSVSSVLLQAIWRARLWRELEDTLDEDVVDEPDRASRTVALVDLVASTEFLASATADQTEQMVDAIHEAGQDCTMGRGVSAVKYVGDGVFLLGRDPLDVIETALSAVRALDTGPLPMRARAGLSNGPVVRRAGDYFGLTVNVTERLVQLAEPGTVLAERRGLPELPDWIEAEDRSEELRGVPGPTDCATLRLA